MSAVTPQSMPAEGVVTALLGKLEDETDSMSGADLHLLVPARSENLTVVRQALAGLGEALGMEPARIADLKTVVTEASTNVVLHAYENGSGPLEVLASAGVGQLDITVRDQGVGFRPRPTEHKQASLGLGLPLIAALSDSFEIRGGADRGTEVRMRVALTDEATPPGEQPEPPIDTTVKMTAGELVRPVLARVFGALGARADFSLDRLADTVLLSDAVSAHSPSDFDASRVGVAITDREGRLEVRVGPLVDGAGERMISAMDLPGPAGTSLRKLADEISVTSRPSGAGEYLVLEIRS